MKTGNEFKFKTRPIDPNDPFRGKYITLFFEEREFFLDSTITWTDPRQFYVEVEKDTEGFAKIKNISIDEPNSTQDYFLAGFSGSRNTEEGTTIFIDFPFDKYFMEESKAFEAEVAVRRSQADTTQITYALVAVKDGESVLKNVFINGIPIREVVLNSRANQDQPVQ